jgi:hypothetical protein
VKYFYMISRFRVPSTTIPMRASRGVRPRIVWCSVRRQLSSNDLSSAVRKRTLVLVRLRDVTERDEHIRQIERQRYLGAANVDETHPITIPIDPSKVPPKVMLLYS